MGTSTRENNGHLICSICQKTFGRTEHLKRHVLSHTKDRRFHCEVCGKNFLRRSVVRLLKTSSPLRLLWCLSRVLPLFPLSRHSTQKLEGNFSYLSYIHQPDARSDVPMHADDARILCKISWDPPKTSHRVYTGRGHTTLYIAAY